MKLYLVARTSDFKDLSPLFAEIDGITVAVYRFNNRYYAYTSWCPHEGGPACEGIVTRNVETQISHGRVQEYASTERYNIACPWHGVEFDLQTGICRADQRVRLRSYEVIINGDEVLVKKG